MFKYPLKELYNNITEDQINSLQASEPSTFEERTALIGKYLDTTSGSTDAKKWYKWLDKGLLDTEYSAQPICDWYNKHIENGNQCTQEMGALLEKESLREIISKMNGVFEGTAPFAPSANGYKTLFRAQVNPHDSISHEYINRRHHTEGNEPTRPQNVVDIKKFMVEEVEKIEDFSWDRCAIVSHRWKKPSCSDERSKIVPWDYMGMSDATLKRICRVLEDSGYDYVWVDTYTGRLDSGIEVTKGLVGFADFYQQAHLTIVPLCTSHNNCECPKKHPTFQEWYSRSWILQEILFSRNIVFFGCNGKLAFPSQLSPIEYQCMLNLKFYMFRLPKFESKYWDLPLAKATRLIKTQTILALASYKESFMDGDRINSVLSVLPREDLVHIIPSQDSAADSVKEIYINIFNKMSTIDALDTGKYNIVFDSALMNHCARMKPTLTHRRTDETHVGPILNSRPFIFASQEHWGPHQDGKTYCCVYKTVHRITDVPSSYEEGKPLDALREALQQCGKVFVAETAKNKIGVVIICHKEVSDKVKLAIGPRGYGVFIDMENNLIEGVYPDCYFINEDIENFQDHWGYIEVKTKKHSAIIQNTRTMSFDEHKQYYAARSFIERATEQTRSYFFLSNTL